MVTGIASSLRGAIWKSLQSTEPNMKKKMVESSQGYFTQIRLNRIYGPLSSGDVSKQELQLFTELLCSYLLKKIKNSEKNKPEINRSDVCSSTVFINLIPELGARRSWFNCHCHCGEKNVHP